MCALFTLRNKQVMLTFYIQLFLENKDIQSQTRKNICIVTSTDTCMHTDIHIHKANLYLFNKHFLTFTSLAISSLSNERMHAVSLPPHPALMYFSHYFVVLNFRLAGSFHMHAGWITMKTPYNNTGTLYQHNPVKRNLIGVQYSLQFQTLKMNTLGKYQMVTCAN